MKRKETLTRAGTRYVLATIVALAFAMMLAVPAAFADAGDTKGSIKVTPSANQPENLTYDVYQIFKADVVGAAGSQNVMNVVWGDASLQAPVEAAIKSFAGKVYEEDQDNGTYYKTASGDFTTDISEADTNDTVDVSGTPTQKKYKQVEAYKGTTAQDAAGYISENLIGNDAGGYTYIVGKDSFAQVLAKALNDASVQRSFVLTPGTAKTDVPEGYVLVVSTDSTLIPDGVGPNARDGQGTSPIYAIIDGAATGDNNATVDPAVPVEITEKVTVPTVDKSVKEDNPKTTVNEMVAYDDNTNTAVKYYKKTDGTFVDATEAAGTDLTDSTLYEQDGSSAKEYMVKSSYVADQNAWGEAADLMINQVTEYRLTGTLPGNLYTFDSYKYEFTDTMSKAIDVVDSTKNAVTTPATSIDNLVVKIGDVVVTEGYTVSYTVDAGNENARVLKVTFADILQAKGQKDDPQNPGQKIAYTILNPSTTLDSFPNVTVDYNAKLNADAKVGSEGNSNKVFITYTRNPENDGDGTTEEDENKLFTYALDILKVDKYQEKTTLDGVTFYLINASDRTEFAIVENGKFAGWTTEQSATVLRTENGGKLNIAGLDEGEYILREITPLDGYTNIGDVHFTISSVLDRSEDNPACTSITATLNGGNNDGSTDANGYTTSGTGIVGVNNAGTTNGVASGATPATSGVLQDVSGTAAPGPGHVAAKLTNEKRITMPLTGMDGITFTYILGGLILAVSVFALLRRKMANNNVQEDVA